MWSQTGCLQGSHEEDAAQQGVLVTSKKHPQDLVQNEIAALRQTIEELQDRVWRTEVQLAAAGSAQSMGNGHTKGSERVETALQEMVALVTQKYTDLEKENRRLSAQVEGLLKHMHDQAGPSLHNASILSPAPGNGHNNSPTLPLNQPPTAAQRHCASVACLACKNRRRKCNGVSSGCAGCSIYGTECTYDLTQDQRRKRSVVVEAESHPEDLQK